MFAIILATLGPAVFLACTGLGNGDGGDEDGTADVKEGAWHLAADRVTSNTCEAAGLTDDEIGEGEAVTVELTLDGDGHGFTLEHEDSERAYDLDGDKFSADYDITAEVEDPCYLRKDVVIEGEFTSKSFATQTYSAELSTEGDCSGINTDGIPCSYEVEISMEYVGD